ncbi:MAG: hypothetical protein HYZ24_01110 [Chloroflexi bacterium]|nr:hypothetical protein [Chloroflexota bacterium]
MTESPAPSKSAKWKRPLIGGLLSALVSFAGVATIGSDSFFLLFDTPFIGIPWIILDGIFQLDDMLIPGLFLTLGIWFVIGAAIAHTVKTNKKAIMLWLLILVLLWPVGAWAIW